MLERESGIGAANLEAEGLEGVLNITKTIAEILSELAQRNIRVEDLIIQTDKGTLQPGMNPADAERFELDIRDVFMNPENKKNFRVFMEDSEGNRTLVFESEGGKAKSDIHNLRNAMMLYYAKKDAEAMGQTFEPYFEEVVIKTGQSPEESASLTSGPDLTPTGPTLDAEAISEEAGSAFDTEPDLSPETQVADSESDVVASESDVVASESDVVAPESDVVASESDVVAPESDVVASESDVADSEADVADSEIEVMASEIEVADSEVVLSDSEAASGPYVHVGPNPESVQAMEIVEDYLNSLPEAEAIPEVYAHVGPNTESMLAAVETVDFSLADLVRQGASQSELNEAFINQAILEENKDLVDESLTQARGMIEEYRTIPELPVDDFVSEVNSVTEAITQIQGQLEEAGRTETAFQGSQLMPMWGAAISQDLSANIPDISTQLKTLANSLVVAIKERALEDLSTLKDLASQKIESFKEVVEKRVDSFRQAVEEKVDGFKNAVEEKISNFKETVAQTFVVSDNVDRAIYQLIAEHSDSDEIVGDTYTLSVAGDSPSVSRNDTGETVYSNGKLMPNASKDDAQAIQSIPSIAAEESNTASRSGGMKR